MSPASVLRKLFVLITAACLHMGCGELRPSHDDAKKAFTELVLVQEAHQKSVAEFAIDRAPQFAEIIKKDTSLILKEWRRRQLQFEYLIDNNPDRLRLRRGREGLISFAWTPDDSLALADKSPVYVTLEEDIEALQSSLAEEKTRNQEVITFFEELERTLYVKNARRVYGRDEQAIVLRYRLAVILKEE
ncbi:MAG: hypothetical protein AB8G77_15340 [Rhodothermales bacterium]